MIQKQRLMKMNKGDEDVFVLIDYNYHWHRIKQNELKKWLEDGSLKEDDLVVYPYKIFKIKKKSHLKLVMEMKK